jgi:hypothetical protein
MDGIAYHSGFKYQLAANYHLALPLKPVTDIDTTYITLDVEGNLGVKRGYAWDGPSGPAIDTKNFMRGSLVHDALYQLMRDGYLDESTYRPAADTVLRALCREDGMSAVRAWWVYHGVRLGGGPAGSPKNRKLVERAP